MNRRVFFTLSLFVGAAWTLIVCALREAKAASPQAQGPRLFLIVAPEKFHSALADYVNFKKRLRPTKLVSLEKVLELSDGSDDPERLKRFLYGAWRRQGLGYVLLVGDVDVMPVRYMVFDRITPAAFDYAFLPSDLYYADLAKANGAFESWNAQRQGFHADYFGEVRGEKNKTGPINFDQIDYRPEIAVGRWPVTTVAQVAAIADKSMAYEESVRTGTHPGMRQADFFHVGGWVDLRDRLNGLARRMPAGWKSNRYLYSDKERQYRTPPPDGSHLLEAINRGAGLVVHVGHGSNHSWNGCFDKKDLPKLDNGDRLPVMFACGCGTAVFAPQPPYEPYIDVDGNEHAGTDHNKEVFNVPPPAPSPYQPGKYNHDGFGEELIRQETNGAVVYIGCDTGAQPCAFTLLEGFLLAVQRSPRPVVGDCWVRAVRYYYEKEHLATLAPTNDWYPPSIFFQGMKFMFFGDPTLPMASPARRRPNGEPQQQRGDVSMRRDTTSAGFRRPQTNR